MPTPYFNLSTIQTLPGTLTSEIRPCLTRNGFWSQWGLLVLTRSIFMLVNRGNRNLHTNSQLYFSLLRDVITGSSHVTITERNSNFVFFTILVVKQRVDQQGLRSYHTERPVLSASLPGIMNTRLLLEPRSDPCLKSTEQQSQQAMRAQITNYGECQQAAQLWIEALFVWRRWFPPPFIWARPFFYTVLDPWMNTTDYLWSHRYFGSSWSIKLILSSLRSALITLPRTALPHSVISIPSCASHRPCWLTFSTQMRVVPTTPSGECLRCN